MKERIAACGCSHWKMRQWTWVTLLIALVLAVPAAEGQTVAKEYVYIGGRLVAIEYTACTPAAPTGLTPANGATGVSLTPTLSWTASTSAQSYDVCFGTSTSPPLVANVTGTTYSPGTLAVSTRYYWRVAAKNVCDTTTSATQNFVTSCPLPGVPGNLNPANGATGVSITATLTWSAVTGATSYDVYIGTSSTPPLAANVTGTSYAPAGLLGGTTYYWRVVAKNSCGATTTSATQNFVTLYYPQPTWLSFSANIGFAGIDSFTITVGSGANMTVDIEYQFTPWGGGTAQTLTDTIGPMNASGQLPWTLAQNLAPGTCVYKKIKNHLMGAWVTLTSQPQYIVRPPKPTSFTANPNPVILPGSSTVTVGNCQNQTVREEYTYPPNGTQTQSSFSLNSAGTATFNYTCDTPTELYVIIRARNELDLYDSNAWRTFNYELRIRKGTGCP